MRGWWFLWKRSQRFQFTRLHVAVQFRHFFKCFDNGKVFDRYWCVSEMESIAQAKFHMLDGVRNKLREFVSFDVER